MTEFSTEYEEIQASPSHTGYFIKNFLEESHYKELEKVFDFYLQKGLREQYEPQSFVRADMLEVGEGHSYSRQGNNIYSAYICIPGSFLPEPLKIFASKKLQDWVSSVTQTKLNSDVSILLHYHPENAREGKAHSDSLSINFKKFETNAELNVWGDEYWRKVAQDDPTNYKTTRAVGMLFYFDDGSWNPGDGGETHLYDSNLNKKGSFLPTRNSFGFFKITPVSFHAFAGANKRPRKALIMWFHSDPIDVYKRDLLVPHDTSLDPFVGLDFLDEKNKLEEKIQLIENVITNNCPSILQTDEYNVGKMMAQKILDWQIPVDFAYQALLLSLTRCVESSQINLFSKAFKNTDFNLIKFYNQIDLSLIWESLSKRSFHFKIRIGEVTYLLLYESLLKLAILASTDFLFKKDKATGKIALEKQIVKASYSLGLKTSDKILKDFKKLA